MAGAGTGLPSQRGQVASTITDTGSYGAAEKARADGLAVAAQGLDRLMRVIEPAANEAAKVQGEQAAAAGEFDQRMLITGADAAYNDAIRTGTMARLGNQRDADLDVIRTRNAFDPDTYQREVQEYRASALNGAVPSSLAIQWATDFDERNTRILSTIRGARAEIDIREARADLVAQNTRLIEEAVTALPGAPVEAAWQSGAIQSAIDRVDANIAALESNPAYAVSPEQAAEMRRQAVVKLKTGAATAYAIGILREQGTDAALNIVQEFAGASTVFETEAERALVVASVRDAVNTEIAAGNQRRNQAASERSANEQAMNRRMDEDVNGYLLRGEGTGLTVEQVRAVHGDEGVVRWLNARSKAAEDRRLFENLPSDPDAAAEEIARRASAQPLASIGMIGDGGDLNTVAAAIAIVESGNRDGLTSADPDGAGPAGGGAMGRMQLLPSTARRIAGQLGLTYDENRLLNDGAYNQQLGRAYVSELIGRYNGDSFLAITAYHAGQGFVDAWLKPEGTITTLTVNGRQVRARGRGDPRSGQITREAWLTSIEDGNPRSADYPRKVLAAMNAGRASAAYESFRQQRRAALADPATSVEREPDVAAARTMMGQVRADSAEAPAARETLVQTYLAAQERADIPANRRFALPMRELVSWAGYLDRNSRESPQAFTAAQDAIMEAFGDAGERVYRDAMIVRGNSAYASAVSAAAVSARRAGAPPPPPAAVQTAQRTESINRAATGNAGVREMTDAEILAAAGLGP